MSTIEMFFDYRTILMVPFGQPPPMDARTIQFDQAVQALERGVALHPPHEYGHVLLDILPDTPKERAQLLSLGLNEVGTCLARSDGRPWHIYSPTIPTEHPDPAYEGPASNAVSVTAFWGQPTAGHGGTQAVTLLIRQD